LTCKQKVEKGQILTKQENAKINKLRNKKKIDKQTARMEAKAKYWKVESLK
jgi:hypothetical protein